MSGMQDRDYQIEAVNSLWNYFYHKSGNPLVAMPTGTGKSVVIARFLQSIFTKFPNQKVLMLTHVKELIQQNYEKLLTVWPFAPCGIYSAGLNQKVHYKPISFCGIGSVYKKWALFGHVDLVLIDEAHLVSPTDETMYQSFIKGLKSMNPYVKVIGFTATPWRLSHGHLTDPIIKTVKGKEVCTPSLFTDVCFDVTGVEAFNRFIAEGYLVPPIPKKTKTLLDVDGVKMRGGEFIEADLQAAVDRDYLTDAAIREAMEEGFTRRKWLVFASGTEHADHIAETLNSYGIPAVCIHSKKEGRDEAISLFKRGKIRAIVNNNMLTTGFDDPEIDLIICLRPTASSVLWVQMLGRGTRPLYYNPDNKQFEIEPYDLNTIEGRLNAIENSGKRNCLVLDYAGNSKRLGPINDPVIPKRKGAKGGKAPTNLCEVCNCYVHASLRNCNGIMLDGQQCTNEFEFETKLKNNASTESLVKGDMPVVEVFNVQHITFSRHEKEGSPPSMKVSYHCGYQMFSEFICIEHLGPIRNRAARWWKERSQYPMPANVNAAIEIADHLLAPTHLRVWINKKYPEILAVCFDGTAFGTKEEADVAPTVDIKDVGREKFYRLDKNDLDDEIPF